MSDKRSRGNDSVGTQTNRFEDRAKLAPISHPIKAEPHDGEHNPILCRYPGLKSASKRKRNTTLTDSQTIKKRHDHSVTSKPRSRPFAPPLRLKSRGKPLINTSVVDTRITRYDAAWYTAVDMHKAWKRSDLQTLLYTAELIKKAFHAVEAGHGQEVAFSILRRRLHQMEFYDFVTEILVVKSKLLDEQGFPAVFDSTVIPWDLRADALMLFKKWCMRQWDPDLLRGIVTKKGTNNREKTLSTRSIDKNYPTKVSANHVGAGDLVNGQWWPLQICTIRDGAHGTPEGGIYGQAGKGAYSIIMSAGGYADIDEGDRIKYCGTSGEEDKPTAFTERMLESFELKNPIRVLRSSALAEKHSRYRPVKGLRYDGTYNITEYEILDKGTSMHRFTLERCAGQDPIRYQGEQVRPTEEELSQYKKVQAHLGSCSAEKGFEHR
ncbi:MAG: hypothetical protein Q9216_004245 [Gyalolechia sp. 2 TL-2023]